MSLIENIYSYSNGERMMKKCTVAVMGTFYTKLTDADLYILRKAKELSIYSKLIVFLLPSTQSVQQRKEQLEEYADHVLYFGDTSSNQFLEYLYAYAPEMFVLSEHQLEYPAQEFSLRLMKKLSQCGTLFTVVPKFQYF